MIKYFINSAFGSFFRTLGRIVAYILFGALIVYLSQFINITSVKASTLDDSMVFYTTGSSFDNKAFSNSSSFSTINANTSHVASNMMLYFTTTEYIDYEILENGQQVFYMTLDICSTGNDVLYDIYNTYDNKIYYTQNTGKTCGFNGGYSGLIYRYYISLLVSGFDTVDTMDGYLIYFNRSIGLRNTASYNVFYRGLSVQIYNQSTFISALNDASGLDMSQQVVNNTQQIIDKTQEQINQNNTIINQNSEAETTRKGILGTLKDMINYLNPFSENFFAYKLVELFLNMLKSLFIPEDMDFVTDFVDVIENKLGFIAEVPIRIIEFILNLATATWDKFDSISFPSISIFGYNFWNAQEIDLTEAINIFEPFKYVTDVICVVICARTLNKWREQFTGGN